MLAMPEIKCIKLMRNQKSLSINDIAKTLHLNWRTVKKYADEDQLPQEKVLKRSGMMYEEKWGEIIVKAACARYNSRTILNSVQVVQCTGKVSFYIGFG